MDSLHKRNATSPKLELVSGAPIVPVLRHTDAPAHAYAFYFSPGGEVACSLWCYVDCEGTQYLIG